MVEISCPLYIPVILNFKSLLNISIKCISNPAVVLGDADGWLSIESG